MHNRGGFFSGAPLPPSGALRIFPAYPAQLQRAQVSPIPAYRYSIFHCPLFHCSTMAMLSHEDDLQLQADLERLFSLQTFGIKLGLGPVSALLDDIGNPQLRFPTVHIAGTNGKGSACAMVASVLRQTGLRVGLYTSPHLRHFTERIRVNGEPMSRERLAQYAREMLPIIERHNCTFFEGTTALGFRYFAEQEVDIAVIETGLGGRLDATNVLLPLVTAVTSISYDHTKHLGDTLEQIAAEKAGIFKQGVPAIVGHVEPHLREVFVESAMAAGADLRFTDDYCPAIFRDMGFEGTTASFMIDGHEIPDVRIGLVGRHQIENARVALGVIDALRRHYTISDDDIRNGFGNVQPNTGIRGRFESVGISPPMILDVAHNPDGVRTLVSTLASLRAGTDKGITAVYGAVQDKDVTDIMRVLAPSTEHLFAVSTDSPRSLSAEEIARRSTDAGISTTIAGSVENGIRMALKHVDNDDVIVICGSFLIVADALAALEGRGLQPEDPTEPRVAEPDTTSYDATADSAHAHTLQQADDWSTANNADDNSTRRLTVKDWSPSEQPRERLMRQGPQALSDTELLAILLRTGTKQEDVLQVSRNTLQRFRTLSQLAARDYSELQQIDGIGPTKAVTLAAAFEIGRRMGRDAFTQRPTVTSPSDVARIYIPLFRGITKEQFHVMILNTASQVIRMEMVSEGSLNSSIVHPREVFRIAITEHAASIIGVHNHPSGNPAPSREDIAVTRQLAEAGKIIGISLNDHIIIAGERFVSMAERGYL